MTSEKQSLKNIKKKIVMTGRKQKWVADRMGMCESQLSEILSGKRVPRNLNKVVRQLERIVDAKDFNFSNN